MVKTVAFLDDISSIGDQRYAQISHSHNSITSGNTSIAAYNGYGETGGRIIKSGQEVGFGIRLYNVFDQANQIQMMIVMEVPIKISEWSHDAFRGIQSVKLGIYDTSITDATPIEVVPLQTVLLDHTKFGGPASDNYGIATDAISNYNQDWFSEHSYNWINDIYNAPFTMTISSGEVSYFSQSWGPLGSSMQYPAFEILTGDVAKQIATTDYVDDKIGNIDAILDEINGEVI